MSIEGNAAALRATISMVVPLKICEIAQTELGMPSDRDWERARDCSKWMNGQDGRLMPDVLIAGYGGVPTQSERQQLKEMTADILFALAVMAFCPLGVKLLGLHIVAPVLWSTETGPDGKPRNVPTGRAKTWPWGWCVEGEVPYSDLLV